MKNRGETVTGGGALRETSKTFSPLLRSLCVGRPQEGISKAPVPPTLQTGPAGLRIGPPVQGPTAWAPHPRVARQDTGQATGIGDGCRWDTEAGRG